MITLKQVAEQAGVSLGTASAAINGRASVKASTRKRVERAAAELGYRKDASASVLAGKQRHAKVTLKQMSLGYVSSPGETHPARNPLLFKEAAEKLGYDMELIQLREYSSLKRAVEHLRFLNIQGLYVASPGALPDPGWLKFPWEHFTVVKGFRAWPELQVSLIRHNSFDYMRETLREVINRGYRRLAVLITRSTVPSEDEARLGALLSMNTLGWEGTFEMEWRMSDTHVFTEELRKWLRTYRPDAVVAFPEGWYFGLTGAGYKLPEDFGFASVVLSGKSHQDFGVSGCASKNSSFPQLGVSILHRMIQSGDKGMMSNAPEIVLEPEWLEGDTLPDRT